MATRNEWPFLFGLPMLPICYRSRKGTGMGRQRLGACTNGGQLEESDGAPVFLASLFPIRTLAVLTVRSYRP